MEAERGGLGPAPLLSLTSSPLPLGGDEAAAPAVADTPAGARRELAGPAILPSSPELLEFDDDEEDLEVFSKVQGKESLSLLRLGSLAARGFPLLQEAPLRLG